MRFFAFVLCLVAVASADHLAADYHPVDRSYIPPGESSGLGAAASNAQAAIDVGSSDGAFDAGTSGASSTSFGVADGGSSSFGGSSSGSGSFGVASSDDSVVVSNAAGAFDHGSSDHSFAATRSGSDFGVAQGSFDSASNDNSVVSGGLEKEFYTFTAAEEDFNDASASQQIANSVKQGLRVVFIKGPENRGLENAALALAKNAANQQTAIYVLNKQADIGELANKLNAETRNSNNGPEVHFVKYRTQEDAIHAQHTIQSEYEALGGHSQNIDGGVASSLNFASAAPASAASVRHSAAVGGGASASHAGAGGNVGSSYLPASVLRRLRL
ncbi:uncharacterized protein LOC142233748 [Haematobia irritans]|uniref:uncharacterized protein LOC142233748 n=1 Tax=Haematobia irritans TaxID=7368 RepID=UPI003F4FD5E8